MQRLGLTTPLLIGGATTSKAHTALRIDPAYTGPVIHVLDASRAVGVASSLVSDTQRDPLIANTADDYDKLRKSRERSGQSELASLDDARANGFVFDPSGQAKAPQYPGLHHFGDWPLADLRASIDWTPFFRAWELAGTYPAILRDPIVGESATSLFADAQAMLDQIIAERWITPKATVGLWRCKREGDDILVLAGNDWTRVPILRQQVKKREGRANMSLADFINPDGEDWIGGFAVGIHGLEPHLERFKQTVDDYDDILLKALADRLAESFAEVLHASVRNRLWGYADEHLSNADLIREKFNGIRPAPGYPACPDHSLKPILFEMLGGNPGEVTLTENFAMLPTSAVSGLLLRPSRQPVFRRRPHRPRPARGLCGPAQRLRRAGDTLVATQPRLTLAQLSTDYRFRKQRRRFCRAQRPLPADPFAVPHFEAVCRDGVCKLDHLEVLVGIAKEQAARLAAADLETLLDHPQCRSRRCNEKTSRRFVTLGIALLSEPDGFAYIVQHRLKLDRDRGRAFARFR